MKRKLDANDVPSPEVAETKEAPDANEADFESLNLDPRLRQALIKEKFTKPTLVQAKAIPLALAGKDILGEYIPVSMVDLRHTNNTSSCKDRLRKDRRICPPYPSDHSPEESCQYSPEIINRHSRGKLIAFCC